MATTEVARQLSRITLEFEIVHDGDRDRLVSEMSDVATAAFEQHGVSVWSVFMEAEPIGS